MSESALPQLKAHLSEILGGSGLVAMITLDSFNKVLSAAVGILTAFSLLITIYDKIKKARAKK